MVKGGIIFRVDGSKELGLGHISRCLNLAETIADEFRDFNVPIHFITVKNPGSDVLFKNSGFSEFVIYIKESADLKNFGKLINDFSPKVLITDIDLRNCTENYLETFFPGLFHASLHEHNFGLLTGDVVIAPTICPMVPCEKGEIGVTHFNGAEYILLSKEIGEIRKSAQPIVDEPRNGIISIGGADPSGLTHNVLSALRAFNFPQIKWNVVLGPSSEYKTDEMIIAYPGGFEFIEGAELGRKGFLDLLGLSDVVITNGGTTLYEAMALKRSCMAVPQNEFEADVINLLDDTGACIGVMDTTRTGILEKLDEFLDSSEKRKGIAERAGEIVDGKGCNRITRIIGNYIR